MKEIISAEKNSDFDDWEIEMRVPGFDNFGKRLGDLEKRAFEAELAFDQTTEGKAEARKTVEALGNQIAQAVQDQRQLAEKISGYAVDDPLCESVEGITKMLEGLPEIMAAEGAGLLEGAEFDPEDDSFDRDHEVLEIALEEGIEWDAEAESRVNAFLASWPQIRSEVHREAFAHYQAIFSQIEDNAQGAGGALTLPAPVSSGVVEDLFTITSLFLFADGRVGISGDCTWDEEHGFGAVIKDTRVLEFAQSDLLYQ